MITLSENGLSPFRRQQKCGSFIIPPLYWHFDFSGWFISVCAIEKYQNYYLIARCQSRCTNYSERTLQLYNNVQREKLHKCKNHVKDVDSFSSILLHHSFFLSNLIHVARYFFPDFAQQQQQWPAVQIYTHQIDFYRSKLNNNSNQSEKVFNSMKQNKKKTTEETD